MSRLFPNPTTTIVVVPEWVGTVVELIDLSGSVLRSERLRGEGLSVAGLPAGTYLLRETQHGRSALLVIAD